MNYDHTGYTNTPNDCGGRDPFPDDQSMLCHLCGEQCTYTLRIRQGQEYWTHNCPCTNTRRHQGRG